MHGTLALEAVVLGSLCSFLAFLAWVLEVSSAGFVLMLLLRWGPEA